MIMNKTKEKYYTCGDLVLKCYVDRYGEKRYNIMNNLYQLPFKMDFFNHNKLLEISKKDHDRLVDNYFKNVSREGWLYHNNPYMNGENFENIQGFEDYMNVNDDKIVYHWGNVVPVESYKKHKLFLNGGLKVDLFNTSPVLGFERFKSEEHKKEVYENLDNGIVDMYTQFYFFHPDTVKGMNKLISEEIDRGILEDLRNKAKDIIVNR